MKKWLLPFLLISSAVVFAQTSTSAPELAPPNLQHEPPMLGIHWARGFDPMAHASQAQGTMAKTVNMTYRGGKIMPTAVTKQIFWGPSWVTPLLSATNLPASLLGMRASAARTTPGLPTNTPELTGKSALRRSIKVM